MKMNDDIQYKNLKEYIYEEIKSLILRGKLLPGTKLTEMDIAAKMNASRTPIRAALKRLNEEGLVVFELYKGARVANVDIRDLIEALEIRENMEATITYYASMRITEKEKEELAEAQEQYKRAVIGGDKAEIIKYDTRFHEIIIRASDNSVMVKIAEELKDLMVRFRNLYYGDFSRAKKVGLEHDAILNAILTGEHEKARDLSMAHIKALREDVMREHPLELLDK
ncbi:MAG: GntR family transcriptional regulator [Eubacteriales bacterium]|nr:GntR family transcriptional regulator [Eubacteriales bacterium]MDY3332322.1 GntR family transcriptional regulator [Gallibacter sp.]